MATAVVPHGRPDVLRKLVDVGQNLLDRLPLIGVILHRVVELGDVSGVVLVVMGFHRHGANVRLQRQLFG